MDQLPDSLAIANLLQLGIEAVFAALIGACAAYIIVSAVYLAARCLQYRRERKLFASRFADHFEQLGGRRPSR